MNPFSDALRALGDNGSYIVDSTGNTYQAYALAWRYLGMYIDCDIDDDEGYGGNDKWQRGLSNDDNDCSRKVLWAAYRDPGYEGGSIGEYQFYDWRTDRWDSSTCQTERCARMDCHKPDTDWELVGVFKETEGLEDWAEQLFKHQGYCLWDGDKNNGQNNGAYDFMQDSYEEWMDYLGCNELEGSDDYGNDLYVDLKPQAVGNFTYGIYYDEACTQPSNMTWGEYIAKIYEEDGDAYYGNVLADEYEQTISRWNELMNDYKICQPCRAYNRVVMGDGDDDDYEGDDFVGNDGGGNSEQWGYNCYDDAGYTNCNQCYKFETQTDLEPATTEDLERASKQGTILSIEVNELQYGNGKIGYNPFHLRYGEYEIRLDELDLVHILILATLLLFIVVIVALFFRYVCCLCCRKGKSSSKKRYLGRRGEMSARLIEDSETEEYDDEEDALQHKNQVLREQEQELNYMQAQIDAGKAFFNEKEKETENELQQRSQMLEEQEHELNYMQAQIDAGKSFLGQKEKETENELQQRSQLLEEQEQELNYMQAQIDAGKFVDQMEKKKVLDLENELQHRNQLLEEQEQELNYMQAQIDHGKVLSAILRYQQESSIDNQEDELQAKLSPSPDAESSELKSEEQLQTPSNAQDEQDEDLEATDSVKILRVLSNAQVQRAPPESDICDDMGDDEKLIIFNSGSSLWSSSGDDAATTTSSGDVEASASDIVKKSEAQLLHSQEQESQLQVPSPIQEEHLEKKADEALSPAICGVDDVPSPEEVNNSSPTRLVPAISNGDDAPALKKADEALSPAICGLDDVPSPEEVNNSFPTQLVPAISNGDDAPALEEVKTTEEKPQA